MSNSINDASTVNTLGIKADPNKTSRGTKIVQAGSDMDKNAFLKILTAELSNQDPESAKDATQYVAQMAQFAGLEQMSNMNTGIQMSSANSMIGKNVYLKTLDVNGFQYSGIVRVISRQGSNVKIGVEVDENGTRDIKEFAYSDVVGVTNNPYDVTNVNNDAMNFLAEASMIGKRAEFNLKDANGNNYAGIVKGIVKNNGSYNLSVLLDGTNETKELGMAAIIKLTNVE